MKRIVFAGALILLAAGLAWTAAAQQPAVLAVAVGNNFNHVPSFVGVEKGIFLKHGVDVKLKVLSTGQEMSKAWGVVRARRPRRAIVNMISQTRP